MMPHSAPHCSTHPDRALLYLHSPSLAPGEGRCLCRSAGGQHGWRGAVDPLLLSRKCLCKPKLLSTQIQGLFRVLGGGWVRAWVMPGVPARTGFSKATSGKKQVTSDRKQTPSHKATDLSYKKLNSTLIFEDIKVPSLLSIIMQDQNSIICHWFNAT